MKESKQDKLSSFIKYLKSFIQLLKEVIAPTIKEKRSYSEVSSPRRKSTRAKGSKLDLHRGEIVHALDSGETKTSIARKYGVSAVNLHHWLKRRKIKVSKKALSQS